MRALTVRPRMAATLAFIVLVTLTAVTGCAATYGASFGYPPQAPAPQTATVVVTDTSSDDDDPIRSRETVVDSQNTPIGALFAFYRKAYPSSKGWTPGQARIGGALCLINHTRRGYTQVLDVFPYRGHRVPTKSGRYLIMISRIEHVGGGDHPCGYATIWAPLDLIQPSSTT